MDNNFQITNVFKRNYEADTTVVLNEGGARSSKSHSICQLLIYKMLKERNKKILITRKTLPSLKITAYKMFVDLLREFSIYSEKNHNKTLRTYEYNTNYVLFTSIDDPTKIQSTEFNYIWMEEAEEFTFDDFVILKTRLSGKTNPGEINQIYLTYNPKQEYSFINKKLKYFEDITLIKSTYKDNPYISDEYIKILESLKRQNDRLYKVFALGEYAEIEGRIFSNVICMKEKYPVIYDEIIYGLDFGYNSPTALVKIGIRDGVFFLEEEIYETKITNSELISKLKEKIKTKRSIIYADSSESNRIEEIYRAGFNIKPADKSVKDGIDFVKSCEIYTKPENANINSELEIYCYKKDKNGNFIDEPVKFADHAMDATRYAIYTHGRKGIEIGIKFL